VADVAMPGENAQRALLATTADQDLRPALLNRSGHVERAIDAIELALERRPLLREHQPRDLHGLLEAVHAARNRRELEAVTQVLVLVPRRPDAQDRPAFRDHVERRHLFREQRRVPIGDAGDQRPELDARGARGDACKGRVGLEHRRGLRTHAPDLIEVVHHGDEVEARSLGSPRLLDHVVEQLVVGDAREREVGHVKAEEQSSHD
jgi:hypothetical protein